MYPYIGEILPVGFSFAPPGWLVCDGSSLQISQFTTLYALIGTTYGGDGVNSFNLPDLRGRTPIHQGTGTGSSYVIGQVGGSERVTLTTNQIPSHTHPLLASSGTSSAGPSGQYFGSPSHNLYSASPATSTMGDIVNPTGGSQPHENRQPFLAITYIIATEGIFPTPN